eukprot:1442090-Heterocapsa_arctica.AAC.1
MARLEALLPVLDPVQFGSPAPPRGPARLDFPLPVSGMGRLGLLPLVLDHASFGPPILSRGLLRLGSALSIF